MATEVVMPQMGYDMTEGTVLRWVKHEGDRVERSEIIAEIETDKATVEMEAETEGVLRKIVVAEGTPVPVGNIIAYIGTPDEPIPQTAVTPPTPSAPVTAPQLPTEPTGPSGGASPLGESRASPVARRLADEKGVDIRQIRGTGPGGRITKDDVLRFAAEAPIQSSIPEEAPPTVEPAAPETGHATPLAPSSPPVADGKITLGRMGQSIARVTAAAKREIPHYYVTVSIDMTQASELRREINNTLRGEARVSLNDMIVKACAMTLVRYPSFNSVFAGDHLEVKPHVNIGIAISLDDGLVVPAVMHCERKPLMQIARESKDLGRRARDGRLRQDEFTLGTFSVSNLGMFHVDQFAAIIVAPQTAVLAVGAVAPTPVVRKDEVVIAQMMKVTLSCDHRVSNGADAALFLSEIKRLLESPLHLALEA